MSTIISKCVCSSCESEFDIQYMTELASTEYPKFCPFCGDEIDELDIIEDEEDELDYDPYSSDEE